MFFAFPEVCSLQLSWSPYIRAFLSVILYLRLFSCTLQEFRTNLRGKIIVPVLRVDASRSLTLPCCSFGDPGTSSSFIICKSQLCKCDRLVPCYVSSEPEALRCSREQAMCLPDTKHGMVQVIRGLSIETLVPSQSKTLTKSFHFLDMPQHSFRILEITRLLCNSDDTRYSLLKTRKMAKIAAQAGTTVRRC